MSVEAPNTAPWPRRLAEAAPVVAGLLALVTGAYLVQAASGWLVPPAPSTLHGALGDTFAATPQVVGRTTTAFGFLLVAAWLAGRVAKALGLPRISGYLVIGLLTGPHFAEVVHVTPLVGAQELEHLRLIEGLAVSMIAFTAGAEIKLDFVRRQARTILRIVAGEFLGVTPAVLVALVALMTIAPLPEALQGTTLVTRLYLALAVAVLAVAAAPAVTLALLRETGARGTFPQLALASTVLKDVLLVVLFSALLATGMAIIGPPGDYAGDYQASPVLVTVKIGLHLVSSLLFGGVVALVLWALGRFLSIRIELFMVLVCFGIAVVSREVGADPLLVALSAGLILTNIGSSKAMPRLLASIDGLLLPVYCVFFAVSGAKLHLDALAAVWPAMLLVVTVRLVSKRVAVTRACRRAGVPEPTASWLWTASMPQAGVTLAMAIQFERTFAGQPWTPLLSGLLLAVVACNELIGPPLMKLGIQRTAEEPKAHAP